MVHISLDATPDFAGSGSSSNGRALLMMGPPLPSFPPNVQLVGQIENRELLRAFLPALQKNKCLSTFTISTVGRSPWSKAFNDLYHPASSWSQFSNVPDIYSTEKKDRASRAQFKKGKVRGIHKALENLKKSGAIHSSEVHCELLQELDTYVEKQAYYREAMMICHRLITEEANKGETRMSLEAFQTALENVLQLDTEESSAATETPQDEESTNTQTTSSSTTPTQDHLVTASDPSETANTTRAEAAHPSSPKVTPPSTPPTPLFDPCKAATTAETEVIRPFNSKTMAMSCNASSSYSFCNPESAAMPCNASSSSASSKKRSHEQLNFSPLQRVSRPRLDPDEALGKCSGSQLFDQTFHSTGIEADEENENGTSPATAGTERVSIAVESELPKASATESVDGSALMTETVDGAPDAPVSPNVNNGATITPPVSTQVGQQRTEAHAMNESPNPQAVVTPSPDRNESIASERKIVSMRRQGLVELLRQRQEDGCKKEEDQLCQQMQTHVDAQDKRLMELLLM